jgi:hypothetical protein
MRLLPEVIMKSQLLILSMCFLLAESAHAQVARLSVDDRIRVTGGLRGTFTVAEINRDTLVMHQGPRVAHSSLKTLSVSRGRRSTASGMARGALIGLGAGAAAGAVVGIVLDSDDDYFYGQYHSTAEVAAVWAATFGFVGLVSGTVVGAIAPGERWERLLPERVRRQPAGALRLGWSIPI